MCACVCLGGWVEGRGEGGGAGVCARESLTSPPRPLTHVHATLSHIRPHTTAPALTWGVITSTSWLSNVLRHLALGVGAWWWWKGG